MDREYLHRHYWDAAVKKEKRRERNPEKKIHTKLTWMEIEPFFQSGISILDAGAGYGRFSIPLARKGFQVTHLEFSSRMLQSARKEADRNGLDNIEFVFGKIQDLSEFSDRSFELTLALDAPVSYAYPEHKRALSELARVTDEVLIFSVVNRLGQLPVAIEMELRWSRAFRIAGNFLKTGNWDHPGLLEKFERHIPFFSRFIFPPLHAFTPEEVADAVIELGFEVKRIAATGTLARLIPTRALRRILKNPQLTEEFLDLSRQFDSRFEVHGVGAKIASGLLIIARRKRSDG